MIKVYGDTMSGNCLKVLYLLRHLEKPMQWIEVDIMAGESRTPEFLALNPAGQIPLVILEDGRPLAQSNAILLHFGEGTRLMPTDAYLRDKTFEWLFWEQNTHEPNVATTIFQCRYLKKKPEEANPEKRQAGDLALDRLEAGLKGRGFLVDDHMTLADLALLPYTSLAPEGGFDLTKRPNIRGWISRCEQVLSLR